MRESHRRRWAEGAILAYQPNPRFVSGFGGVGSCGDAFFVRLKRVAVGHCRRGTLTFAYNGPCLQKQAQAYPIKVIGSPVAPPL